MHKNSYNPKTLNGNWHENRYTEDYNILSNQTSNTYLSNPSHNKYVPISKAVGNKQGYQKEDYGNATENWMNFQPQFAESETFKTTTGSSFQPLGDRSDKFHLRQTGLTSDQAALDEYRKKWTNGNHNFARSYLGSGQWKKSDQED